MKFLLYWNKNNNLILIIQIKRISLVFEILLFCVYFFQLLKNEIEFCFL